MTDSTQVKMAKGAVWMILFKLVERGLGLISTLILARLLAPGDFGVVAMAMSFIAMAELMSAFSFDTAIIHNQDATEEHYNSAWTCSFLLGLIITLMMVAVALPISNFYHKPELMWVVIALAFGPLFTGAQNIGVVAFQKELDFRREFRFQVSRKFISFIIVVPLAFYLKSYWALVIGILVSKAAGTLISYLMHPYRPRFSLSKARELLVFSRWLLVNNFAGFFKERSADFFVGRISGAASLGTYNIAYELANLPTTEIGAPINRALLPGFAKMREHSEIASAYGNAVGLLALLALPTAACMNALAPFLIPVMLGQKWLGVIPLMQLLAFNGALLLFHSSICAVLIGRGFPARVMYTNVAYTVILLALLSLVFLGMRDLGVVGAAYAALFTSVVSTPLYLYQLRKCLGLAPSLFVKAIARPLIASACVMLVVHAVLPDYDASLGFLTTFAWLVAGGLLAVATYLVLIGLMWHGRGRPAGAEQVVLERVRGLLAKRFGPTAPEAP
ncbi:oligosaccharide flippase family protein [Hydrogenophaga sp.]|uniref:lipopolysaccharide biosynthesis protein n=1 Tax=Hydrogenophaga sp. TaxID=1904254 RepID=UPI003566AAF0